ncbi:thioesterase II family protein [Pedobacter sp. KACC 23697]|uniref:Alpha/beta fold hydrolase n=1 Tax=Pedobacter sp. KACC 23697 TaxID=3149230 RepID=A0AAU7K956_9SPHI
MPKPQLFFLHFAGGNCYSYQQITPLLKDFDIVPLELPGRGRRMDEDLLKDYEMAAQDFYQQIVRKLCCENFAVYGHSMGATLAIRVVELLESDGKKPIILFVSGNPGPGANENRHRYLMPTEDFREELKLLGGVPDAFLENKELFDFFEPILRADFEIAEGNNSEKVLPVNTPIYAMMGSLEEKIDRINTWSRFTQKQFRYEILEGDHFFIMKHPSRIAEIIRYNFSIQNFSESSR